MSYVRKFDTPNVQKVLGPDGAVIGYMVMYYDGPAFFQNLVEAVRCSEKATSAHNVQVRYGLEHPDAVVLAAEQDFPAKLEEAIKRAAR